MESPLGAKAASSRCLAILEPFRNGAITLRLNCSPCWSAFLQEPASVADVPIILVQLKADEFFVTGRGQVELGWLRRARTSPCKCDRSDGSAL